MAANRQAVARANSASGANEIASSCGSARSGMRTTSLALAVIALAALAFCASCLVATPQAFANKTIEVTDGNGSPMEVSDDVTRLTVNKFDADSHEHLKGAKLVVIEEASGAVVDEWTTDGSAHELTRILNVGVNYILREIQAPENYGKVADVVFVLDEVEGQGVSIVKSGGSDQAEKSDATTISLYDKNKSKASTKANDKPATKGNESNAGSASPQTGDNLPILIVGCIVCVGLVALVIMLVARRRMRR